MIDGARDNSYPRRGGESTFVEVVQLRLVSTYVFTHFGDVMRTVDVWKVKLLNN